VFVGLIVCIEIDIEWEISECMCVLCFFGLIGCTGIDIVW